MASASLYCSSGSSPTLACSNSMAPSLKAASASSMWPQVTHLKAAAFKCVTCGHILDALAAFKDGAIEFEHAKVGLLPDEQYKEAEAIQKEREKRFSKRTKKAEKDKD